MNSVVLQLSLLRQEAKYLKLNAWRLDRRNRRSARPVVSKNGPVVSLTTFGSRLGSVHLAIESIGAGTVLPSRLILWLDDKPLFDNRPAAVRRLESRGLEVLLSENYGPHTKYYPYVQSHGDFKTALVTADDDVLYSSWWLEGLANAFKLDPSFLNCYRAHVMSFEGKHLRPYTTWGECRSNQPSFRHFATGVSGCIYPPELLQALKAAGSVFRDQCPRADDVWLNAIAMRNGFRVRQVGPRPLRFPLIAGTQGSGLWNSNVIGSQNDSQIEATYTADDLSRILSA